MRLTKSELPIDVDNQSLEVPNSGGIRQSTLNPAGVLSDYLYSDTKTVVEVLQRGSRVSKNGPCLGWRDSDGFKWLSYEEVIKRSRTISTGLVSSGIKPGQDTFIGIYAQNSVEWVLVEHACYCQSWVTVPLYETLGPNAVTYILNHVEAETVVCDTNKINRLLDARDELPNLKRIVAIQKLSEEVKKQAAEKNIVLYQLKDIEDFGKGKSEILNLPSPSDLATVCYTSGTTGNPKGVMITHGSIVINGSGYLKHLGSNYIGPEDRHLSYLPLAHILERLCHVIYFMCGSSIGFFRGDIKYLMEDISEVKPTMLIGVPRVMNKIYDKILKALSSSKLKSFLLNAALRAKEAELKRGLVRNDSIWDRLILKNIRNILGGKVRMLVTGGAPIRNEVLLFFRCCLGCAVINAYGQTETVGAIACSVIGEYDSGVVGPPMPSCFVKLIDVPDMNYYAKNGEGEIIVKGPTVTKGYYKDPQKTAELLDEDGWLYTGDIARWTKKGTLAIIDRKKSILKLSQGEYISPEKTETVYLASPYVEQIFVYGDSLENCIVAIVVPAKDELLSWCSESGVKGSFEEICQNEVVKTHILKHLLQLGKEAGLNGLEQVKAIHLHPDVFSLENGMLTATMKIKRNECYAMFKDDIKKMYQNLHKEEKR